MDSILEMQERFPTVCPGMDSILEMHGYTDVAGRVKQDARAEERFPTVCPGIMEWTHSSSYTASKGPR